MLLIVTLEHVWFLNNWLNEPFQRTHHVFEKCIPLEKCCQIWNKHYLITYSIEEIEGDSELMMSSPVQTVWESDLDSELIE